MTAVAARRSVSSSYSPTAADRVRHQQTVIMRWRYEDADPELAATPRRRGVAASSPSALDPARAGGSQGRGQRPVRRLERAVGGGLSGYSAPDRIRGIGEGDQVSGPRSDGSRPTWPKVMTANQSVTEPHRLTPKGRAARERIVVAAAQLMYDHGVAGTSLGDVQKAAGVGPSQVYHYFGDKESLIRAVIAHRLHALLATLEGLDSMEGLRAWRDFVVDAQRQRNCEGGCLVGELAEPYPQCRADLVGGFDQWETAIRTGLQAMCDRGNLRRTANPERLATALLAAVEGGTVLAQVRRDPAPLETALDEVLGRIEDLRPRRAPPRR